MKRVFLGWAAQPFPNYVAALERLGMEVERKSADGCDALLLPGGGDIDPQLYGQCVCGAEDISRTRDDCELALFRHFAGEGKPILGICRGLQLINVALGGTLRQHIDGHSRVNGADRRHDVRTDDKLLLTLYGERFTVNSAHHQCVDRPGDGLRAAAWAADGTIEAIRHETLPVFAAQWHPERLGAEGERLLRAFIAEYRKN